MRQNMAPSLAFRLYSLIALCCWTFLGNIRTIAGDDVPPLDPPLSLAVEEYETAIGTARERFLPSFDKFIAITRNNKSLSAEDSARIITELESHRDSFESQGVVPAEPSLLKMAEPYAREADRAGLKLSNAFQKAAKARVAANKADEAKALLRYRDKLIMGEGYELVGHWRLAEGIGAHGFSEQYIIQKRLGQWSVERLFYEPNGRKVGASSGVSLKYNNGVLSYTDHFTKKPRAEWHDKAEMKISVAPNVSSTLKLNWIVGSGQSDVITLVPVQ